MMTRMLMVCVVVLAFARGALAGEAKSGPRSLTVSPDPFRAGSQVVRDGDTGKPLYRVRPDPFRDDSQRIEEYGSGKPVGELRPDPFDPGSSEVDR